MKMPKPPNAAGYINGEPYWTMDDLRSYGKAREEHVWALHGDAIRFALQLLKEVQKRMESHGPH